MTTKEYHIYKEIFKKKFSPKYKDVITHYNNTVTHYNKNVYDGREDPMYSINLKMKEMSDFYGEVYSPKEVESTGGSFSFPDEVFSIGEKLGKKIVILVDSIKSFDYKGLFDKFVNWIKSDLNKGKVK